MGQSLNRMNFNDVSTIIPTETDLHVYRSLQQKHTIHTLMSQTYDMLIVISVY